jgi:hypothetical protein
MLEVCVCVCVNVYFRRRCWAIQKYFLVGYPKFRSCWLVIAFKLIMYTKYILRHSIKDIFLLHLRIITVFLKYYHVNDGKVSVARTLLHSGRTRVASPPAALRQGIARAAVDHVVGIEVLAPVTTRGPQTGSRAGGCRPCSCSGSPCSSHHPRPSDRESRGRLSTM